MIDKERHLGKYGCRRQFFAKPTTIFWGKPMNFEQDSLGVYLDEINRIPLLSLEQERALAIRARNGDTEARHELVKGNLRFVVKVAKKYQFFGVSLEDLIEEGNIGMLIAVDKFDPDRGVKFISYAVWSVRRSIIEALHKQRWFVWHPRDVSSLMREILRERELFFAEFGKPPTEEELARRLETTVEKVRRAIELCARVSSLDAPRRIRSENTSETFYSRLPGHLPNPEESFLENEEVEVREKLVRDMTTTVECHEPHPRSRAIVRHVIHHFDESLRTVGKKHGVSGEHVRNVRDRWFKKFRTQFSLP